MVLPFYKQSHIVGFYDGRGIVPTVHGNFFFFWSDSWLLDSVKSSSNFSPVGLRTGQINLFVTTLVLLRCHTFNLPRIEKPLNIL